MNTKVSEKGSTEALFLECIEKVCFTPRSNKDSHRSAERESREIQMFTTLGVK